MMRGTRVVALALIGAVVVVEACTGSDPDAVGTAPDSGASSSGTSGSGTSGTGPDDGGGVPEDAAKAPCDLSKPFAAPVRVFASITGRSRYAPRITADDLGLYVTSDIKDDGDGGGQPRIWAAKRSSPTVAFAEPVLIDALKTSTVVSTASPTADNLTLYFDRVNVSLGRLEIAVATRTQAATEFGTPAMLLRFGVDFQNPFVFEHTDRSRELWVATNLAPDRDIYVAAADDAGGFDAPAKVQNLSATGSNDVLPVLSHDGLVVAFSSTRENDAAPAAPFDIWFATRSAVGAEFSAPARLDGVNTLEQTELTGSFSADGCRFYFTRGVDTANYEIFVATRP